jgi:DNA-binding MarR family transcriptional regulator
MSGEKESADIVSLIVQASRAQVAAMMARLAARGFDDMTCAFATVMPLIDATGIRSSVLAQQTGVTKQAVSQLVRLLKDRGYVELAPDATDSRAKVVRLTKRGIAVKKACMDLHEEFQLSAVKALGKKDLSKLKAHLIQYIASVASAEERSPAENACLRGA